MTFGDKPCLCGAIEAARRFPDPRGPLCYRGYRGKGNNVAIFRDAEGKEWQFSFDGFVLDEVKKTTGIDLADLSAGGWWTLETDAGAVGRVMATVVFLSGDTARRKMAAAIRGKSIVAARDALVLEGADFFPQNEWFVIQSNLAKRRTNEATVDTATVEPLMRLIGMLPQDMQRGA